MRKRVVAIGIVFALVGVAVWYLPLQTVSTNLSIPQGKSQVVGLQAPLDLLGAPITYTLHWSSSSSSVVAVYRCGASSACTSTGPGTLVARGTGTSGSLSWKGPPGDYFHIIPSGPIEVTFEELEPVLGGSVGLSVLAFGAFVAVFGSFLAPPPEEERTSRGTVNDEEAEPSPAPTDEGSEPAPRPPRDR